MSEATCIVCGWKGEPSEHRCQFHNPEGWEFVVDGKVFRDQRPSLSVSELRRLVEAPCNYGCFLQRPGNEPDESLSESQAVDLRTRPEVYFVPPATF